MPSKKPGDSSASKPVKRPLPSYPLETLRKSELPTRPVSGQWYKKADSTKTVKKSK